LRWTKDWTNKGEFSSQEKYFSKKTAPTGSRYTAEKSADNSPVRKNKFFKKKAKLGVDTSQKQSQTYLEPEKHGQ
jgi:hypothetical protein